MENAKIIRNSAKCLKCNEEIESKHRHDFKSCSCGNLSVDGGHSYLKRSFMGNDTWKDTSVCEPYGKDNRKLYECRYEVVYYALTENAKDAQHLINKVSGDDPFNWFGVSAHEFIPDKSAICGGWDSECLVYGPKEDLTLGEAIQIIKDKIKDDRQLELPF